MDLETAIVGGTVVLPDAEVSADIGIQGGQIATIVGHGFLGKASNVIDASGKYVLPGLVDPHTHPGNFRALGPDLYTETRSAAVGGVTTMLGIVKSTRMEEPSDEVTSKESVRSYPETFEYTRGVSDERSHVDVAYSFVMMNRDHVDEIPRCIEECGVTSFKFFLLQPSETTWGAHVGMPLFPDEGVIFEGFRQCASSGALAMVHAENGRIVHEIGDILARGKAGLRARESSSPGYLEASEVRKAAYFARITGARYYAVHISSREGLAAVEAERRDGTPIVAETCPQYLVLNLEDISESRGLGRFTPPIRHKEDVEALWAALANGGVATIGSDHIPLRTDGGTAALGGSPGVATSLPLMWTFGVQAGRLSRTRLVELMSSTPARTFDLYPRKGTLTPGADADLIIVDGASKRRVEPDRLESWSDCSAYEGMELAGWPTLTMVRGAVVARDGRPVGDPRGRYLFRTPSHRRS